MKKLEDFTYYESVFHQYDGANQTRILLDLARLKMKNCGQFNMAAYGLGPGKIYLIHNETS